VGSVTSRVGIDDVIRICKNLSSANLLVLFIKTRRKSESFQVLGWKLVGKNRHFELLQSFSRFSKIPIDTSVFTRLNFINLIRLDRSALYKTKHTVILWELFKLKTQSMLLGAGK